MIEPTDEQQWNADMDAWALTGDQRTHYLWRLHAYHRRIEDLHWRRWERAERAEAWFALALLAAMLVGLVIW
jgi:hypothetical protein